MAGMQWRHLYIQRPSQGSLLLLSRSVSATRAADQVVGEKTHLLPSQLPQAAGGSLQTVDGGSIV
eukprot:26804-Eustigmatos_ZCMA.PRE.1